MHDILSDAIAEYIKAERQIIIQKRIIVGLVVLCFTLAVIALV